MIWKKKKKMKLKWNSDIARSIWAIAVTLMLLWINYRLWNDHGQSLLEAAHICLINANALGTEILKSLVLPGIGAFTIIDGNKVTDEDIGSK